MIRKALVALLLVAAPANADVVRVEVKSRADVLSGQPFGATGPCEKLSGTIFFAIDPRAVDERYQSRDQYLALITKAANDLVEKGYLLKTDVTRIVDQAATRWEYVTARAATQQ